MRCELLVIVSEGMGGVGLLLAFIIGPKHQGQIVTQICDMWKILVDDIRICPPVVDVRLKLATSKFNTAYPR